MTICTDDSPRTPLRGEKRQSKFPASTTLTTLDWFCDLIKTRMHNNTWFVSPLYIVWSGQPVYCLDKLTLAKIDFWNRISFIFNVFKQLFIYRKYSLYPSFDFDASNSPKLTRSSLTLFLNLAQSSPCLMALKIRRSKLLRNELVDVCRMT